MVVLWSSLALPPAPPRPSLRRPLIRAPRSSPRRAQTLTSRWVPSPAPSAARLTLICRPVVRLTSRERMASSVVGRSLTAIPTQRFPRACSLASRLVLTRRIHGPQVRTSMRRLPRCRPQVPRSTPSASTPRPSSRFLDLIPSLRAVSSSAMVSRQASPP